MNIISPRHPLIWVRTFLIATLVALVLVALLFGFSLFPFTNPDHGVIESITGIPFPASNNRTLITEPLAHTDINLSQPVIAQTLTLNIEFIPYTTQQLTLGIRENSFWLSYDPQSFYTRPANTVGSLTEIQHATVTIPLTDKLQEANRSVDLMIFADTTPSDFSNPGPHNSTQWELVNLTATTPSTIPTKSEVRDWLASILHRERPL